MSIVITIYSNESFLRDGHRSAPVAATASLAPSDTDITPSIQHVADAWPDLREAILTLIDAAFDQQKLEGSSHDAHRANSPRFFRRTPR